MKKIALKFSILLLVISINFQAFGQWKLAKNKDGVQVYLPENPPEKGQKFLCHTIINSDIETVLHFIISANTYKQWISDVKEAQNISKNGNEYLIWYKISMPLGFADRDIVLLNKVNKPDENHIKITLLSKPKQKAPVGNCIRIEDANGYWLLKKIEEKKIEVTYEFFLNPLVDLPLWLFEKLSVNSPYETLKNLKTISEKQ